MVHRAKRDREGQRGWDLPGAALASAVAGSRCSLGYVSSQLVLFMRMLFAVGCQADGNLHYRLSSWAVGVKTKLSLYSSTLMRNASPSCFGTGGACFMLALDLVTVARKKTNQKTWASGLYCCGKFLPPTSPTPCLFLSVGKAWQQLENYQVCVNVMVKVHWPHSPASSHEHRRDMAHNTPPPLHHFVLRSVHITSAPVSPSFKEQFYRNRVSGLTFLPVFLFSWKQ